MNRKLPILPQRSDEAVQEQLIPHYVEKASNDTVFTHIRGNDIASKGDKDFSIGLKDIDEAVKYYFDNIIKPSVIQNGQKVNVPIIYNSQELWKSIQADGYYRDGNNKIMSPLITFKRDSIEKNRTLGNKLDGNKVHLHQIFEKKYNKQNHYDNFSVLTNRIPIKEFVATIVPDYVTLSYSCVIFTSYMEQINPIIEAINFASDAYWGDYNRFKFRANIDSFTNIAEITVGDESDRLVKATFNIKLYGYLIPNTVNKQIASIDGFFSKGQVIFDIETTTNDLDTVQFAEQKPLIGATNLIDSYNANITSTNNYYVTGIGAEIAAYINVNITKTADITTAPNQAIFTDTSILQPPGGSGLPATTVNNFTFFINGQYVPSTLITLVESGGNVTATFNTTALGYTITPGDSQEITPDEIIAIGKWLV